MIPYVRLMRPTNWLTHCSMKTSCHVYNHNLKHLTKSKIQILTKWGKFLALVWTANWWKWRKYGRAFKISQIYEVKSLRTRNWIRRYAQMTVNTHYDNGLMTFDNCARQTYSLGSCGYGVQIQNSWVTVGFWTRTVYGAAYFQFLSLVCMMELMCDRFRNPPFLSL